MPIVRFPAVMKYYVNNQTEFFIPAETVKEVLDQILDQYPSVKFHLVDSGGNLRKHFNVFVNGTHIRDLSGMDTPLNEEDKVILMASAAGGSWVVTTSVAIAEPDTALTIQVRPVQ